jgi:hypothetical protein
MKKRIALKKKENAKRVAKLPAQARPGKSCNATGPGLM